MDEHATRSALFGLPLCLAAATAAVAACSSSTTATPGHDGGAVDATHADTGTHNDAVSPKPDAGHGDAHAADTGLPSDAGVDSAVDSGPPYASSPSCTGIPYCDGFETYDASVVTNGMTLGPWAASVSHAVVTIDSLNPYSGKKALHIQVAAVPDSGAEGILQQKNATGLVTGNDMFGRAMLYYSTTGDAGLPLGVHSWIFQSTGISTADDGGVSMNLGGGGEKLQLNYHPPPPATEQSVVGGMVTTGAWHCIQWQYDGAGTPAADLANVWIDGAEAVGVDAGKGWKFATPWTLFDFGFTHYQTLTNPVDVFLDDFALGPTKIDCP